MRAPSVSDLRSADTHPLPTPSQSFVVEEWPAEPSTPANASDATAADVAEQLSRTPLLPPVMTALRREEEPVQSPLQSPKIASSPCSPFDSPAVQHGLPSPPLSTRPSVSSFHHHQRPHVIPSSDIPAMFLANPSDEWASKLGHANFTIHPEPRAVVFAQQAQDGDALRQFVADWEEARATFARHLDSTRAHYGAASKVHALTQQKWIAIDAVWKRHHDEALKGLAVRRSLGAPPAAAAADPATAPTSPNVLEPESPAASARQATGLDVAQCDKFPAVRLEDIVGPMEQAKRPEAPRESRKRAFWRFLQGILPESVVWARTN